MKAETIQKKITEYQHILEEEKKKLKKDDGGCYTYYSKAECRAKNLKFADMTNYEIFQELNRACFNHTSSSDTVNIWYKTANCGHCDRFEKILFAFGKEKRISFLKFLEDKHEWQEFEEVIFHVPAEEVMFEQLSLIIVNFKSSRNDHRAVNVALQKAGGREFLEDLIKNKRAQLIKVEYTDGFEDWWYENEFSAGVVPDTIKYIELRLSKTEK